MLVPRLPRRPLVQAGQVEALSPVCEIIDTNVFSEVRRAPGDDVRQLAIAPPGLGVRGWALDGEVQEEAAIALMVGVSLGERRVERVDPLLPVQQLPCTVLGVQDRSLAALTADDPRRSACAAQQQCPDRVAGQKRVHESAHPVDVPHLVALDQSEVPTLVSAANLQELAVS